jgi:hypothetical protein
LAFLQAQARWIAQLLADHQRERALLREDSRQRLAALQEVLDDPRFRYPEMQTPKIDPDVPEAPVLPWLATLFQALVTLVAAGVIAAVFYYLVKDLQIQPLALTDAGEIEDIPATAQAADERMHLALERGDYRSAIRYLYLGGMLSLDERRVITFDPTLTNREHLRLLRDKPQLYTLLAPLVNIFDRVWYGFAPVSPAQFEEFKAGVDQIKKVDLA